MKKIFIDGSQGTTGLKIYKRFEKEMTLNFCILMKKKEKTQKKEQK